MTYGGIFINGFLAFVAAAILMLPFVIQAHIREKETKKKQEKSA